MAGLTDLAPETLLTEPMFWSMEQESAYWQDQDKIEDWGGVTEVGLAEKLQLRGAAEQVKLAVAVMPL